MSIAPKFKEKGSSRNEIILHKVFKNNWVWENFREDYTTVALFAGIKVTILVTILIVSLSDPKLWNAFFHYLMNIFNWMLVQWTSKLCPFYISKKYLLGTGTL